MGMAAGPNRGVKSDINVTPLVDVCLVLLIIFMVVTPMLQRGKDVTLPEATKKALDNKNKEEDPLILSVTTDKKIYLEQDEKTPEQMEDGIRMKLSTNPAKPVMLKADVKLNFEDVRNVMNIARKAGAKGIKLGVAEQGK